jgi:putative ABC transport system permease protein
LNIRLGDSIKIGNGQYRIAARIAREPDRMTTGFTLGPRVLFTREGLAGAGIIIPGSRITERILLKLPPDHDLAATRGSIEQMFGRRARVTDFTETNPQLTRALDRATRFLSLVSLIALIVAGIGVGATMQSHLRQKMPNIAFMKCIGGRAAQITRIYVVQALMIGLAGGITGAVIGAFAQAVFARLVASYFDIAVILIWPWAAMLKGMAIGMGGLGSLRFRR